MLIAFSKRSECNFVLLKLTNRIEGDQYAQMLLWSSLQVGLPRCPFHALFIPGRNRLSPNLRVRLAQGIS